MFVSFLHTRLQRLSHPRRPAAARVLPAVEALEPRNLLDSSSFIRGLYSDLLHRPASDGEVNQWTSALQNGLHREDAVRLFVDSSEHHARLIQDDYQRFLGRAPGQAEVNGWVNAMAGGMTQEQVQVGFLASAEYLHRHGDTFDGWLNGVYHDVLDRDPDDAGKAGWEAQLQHGMPLAQAAAGFVLSHERHSRDVDEAYQEILHRSPDDAGRQGWENALDHGMDHDQLEEGLAESGEYEHGHGLDG